MVVGFDIYDRQPKLALFHEQYRDVVHRIKWVHGNFLDGLPFPPSYFDFVRIANIGLGVPEDEWQSVFEEVFRIMKPGAVIEVTEEDPIFPCARRTSLLPHARPELPPISVDVSLEPQPPSAGTSHKNYMNIASDLSCGALHDDRPESSVPSSNPPISVPLSDSSPIIPYSPPSFHQSSHILFPDVENASDLLDHSKLKEAWDSMLSARFITKNLSAVLPLYFSSLFDDVQIHPPLKIPLPPNSGNQVSWPKEASFTESLTSYTSTAGPSLSLNTRTDDKTLRYNLHLAKTVNTVKSCKTAIWEEYKKLYATGFTAVAPRTAAGGRSGSEASLREIFDEQWSAWENDMLDRIEMRSLMLSELGWGEPEGDKPEYQSWRSLVEKFSDGSGHPSTSSSAQYDPKDLDLCRSIRAFVGRKL